ncbi:MULTISPECIES: cytidine deaminase [Bacillus]|uniref:cytidine deaminase n=1 Tax=Bacillus TaxID=1386 RepID=UPI0002DDFD20|nr:MULTISPECIES: cytidine deaminase [Bacillus]
MNIEKEMFVRVTDFVKERFPQGWGGAAIMYTDDDDFLISVALESPNGGAILCMETGAFCEAQKYNKGITHSLCVARDDEHSPFKVLTPCGICQERLMYWGEDIKAAISTEDGTLHFKSLKELQPYHWLTAYKGEKLEHYEKKTSQK